MYLISASALLLASTFTSTTADVTNKASASILKMDEINICICSTQMRVLRMYSIVVYTTEVLKNQAVFIFNPCCTIIIIIIIIKTSSTGPSRKTKLFINCFRSPTSTCSMGKENATQGSNQRLTAPLNPSSVPVSYTV